jgi:signal transduction histidine kinase
LVAGVAHEINNPVGTSLTVASSLERKTELFAAEVARGNLKRSSLQEFIEVSREASSQLVANLDRAAELIQSFKQVATDRSYSNQRSFDLGALTEQVFLSLRPRLEKQNLTLNVECQPGLTMNSYPGPYGQVLTNLLLNSVTHAFPDGNPGTVDVKMQASGSDHVEILFLDDGCEMSVEVRRKAFDPFFTSRSRHWPRPAHRPQHRHELFGWPAHSRQRARQGDQNPANPAACGAGSANCPINEFDSIGTYVRRRP